MGARSQSTVPMHSTMPSAKPHTAVCQLIRCGPYDGLIRLHNRDTLLTRTAKVKKRGHHHVYVIALSPAVLQEARFVRANPGYLDGKPCVYVGMTGLDPDVRFDKHMAGIQSNRYVLRYGQQLLPDLYEAYNPMPYQEAVAMEVELGILLREAGFGVWQA